MAFVFQIKFKINNYLVKQLKMFLQIKYIISKKSVFCVLLYYNHIFVTNITTYSEYLPLASRLYLISIVTTQLFLCFAVFSLNCLMSLFVILRKSCTWKHVLPNLQFVEAYFIFYQSTVTFD